MKRRDTSEEKIKKLSPERREEVDKFIDSILQKETSKSPRFLDQTWAGGLSEYRQRYTSLELQKKAVEWRK